MTRGDRRFAPLAPAHPASDRRLLGPDEHVTFEPGDAHEFWNAGDEPLHVEVELRPAMRTDLFMRFAFGLSQVGRTTRSGIPLDPLRLGLLGDRAHHVLVEIDMLDLDAGHLDSPWVTLLVNDALKLLIELFSFREQFVQVVSAHDGSQGGLCELPCGIGEVLNLKDRLVRVHDAIIDDRIDRGGDIVFGDDILRRHVSGNDAKVDGRHPEDRDPHEPQSGLFDAHIAPKEEHDAALVLLDDSNTGSGVGHDRYDGDNEAKR